MSRTYGLGGGEGVLIQIFDLYGTELDADDLDSVVALKGNNQVGDLSDGAMVAGKLHGFTPDGLSAMVQTKGVILDVPYYASSLPAIGNAIQGQAKNKVDVAADVKVARGMVLNVDTTAVTCDILL